MRKKERERERKRERKKEREKERKKERKKEWEGKKNERHVKKRFPLFLWYCRSLARPFVCVGKLWVCLDAVHNLLFWVSDFFFFFFFWVWRKILFVFDSTVNKSSFKVILPVLTEKTTSLQSLFLYYVCLSLTLSHTHFLSLSLFHTHTHSHSLSLSLSHAHIFSDRF